jgi:hypothetical protein
MRVSRSRRSSRGDHGAQIGERGEERRRAGVELVFVVGHDGEEVRRRAVVEVVPPEPRDGADGREPDAGERDRERHPTRARRPRGEPRKDRHEEPRLVARERREREQGGAREDARRWAAAVRWGPGGEREAREQRRRDDEVGHRGGPEAHAPRQDGGDGCGDDRGASREAERPRGDVEEEQRDPTPNPPHGSRDRQARLDDAHRQGGDPKRQREPRGLTRVFVGGRSWREDRGALGRRVGREELRDHGAREVVVADAVEPERDHQR